MGNGDCSFCQHDYKTCWRVKYAFDPGRRLHLVTSCAVVSEAMLLPVRVVAASLSFSGSNQAREGRLVNALAVRGDERRDTLR